jgi:hypothetical protein
MHQQVHSAIGFHETSSASRQQALYEKGRSGETTEEFVCMEKVRTFTFVNKAGIILPTKRLIGITIWFFVLQI